MRFSRHPDRRVDGAAWTVPGVGSDPSLPHGADTGTRPPDAGAGVLDGVAEWFGPQGPGGDVGVVGGAGVEGALTAVGALAARFAARDGRADGDQRRVNNFVAALSLAGRLEALAGLLAAELDASGAAERATGASACCYAASDCGLTQAQACRVVSAGKRLSRRPATSAAVLDGVVNPRQGEAIVRALGLAAGAGAGGEVLEEMEHRLLEAACLVDSQGLAECGRALFEALAPEEAQDLDQARAEAQERRALADRGLSFVDDGAGQVHLNGRLPSAEGALVRRTVEFYAAQAADSSHNQMLTEPAHLQTPDRRQRLADGLVAMAEAAAAPETPAGRSAAPPRLVVTCDLEDLRRGVAEAGVVGAGEAAKLSAGELRLIACRSEVMPAVMGSGSQVLDLGRAKRLAGPGLRQALALRDRGCSFPGCGLPPERWEIRLQGGLPVVLPPRRVDWERKPRRHQRHIIPELAQPPPTPVSRRRRQSR
jgi:hypothetical protein